MEDYNERKAREKGKVVIHTESRFDPDSKLELKFSLYSDLDLKSEPKKSFRISNPGL
jgi:hypothetical protein